MASAVQFRGAANVLQAYQDRDVPSWALFQGKQFLVPCVCDEVSEGHSQLSSLLEKLEQGGTNAIYTLKVYEEIPGGKIKENTPSDGSFNFQLNADTMTMYQGKQQYVGSIAAIESKLAAIERKLGEKDSEPEELSTYDKVMGFVETPAGSMVLQTVLGAILNKQIPAQPIYRPSAINGIGDSEEKIKQAIEVLQQHDTMLGDHLMKLAKIAIDNPQSFKFLLTTLDSM